MTTPTSTTSTSALSAATVTIARVESSHPDRDHDYIASLNFDSSRIPLGVFDSLDEAVDVAFADPQIPSDCWTSIIRDPDADTITVAGDGDGFTAVDAEGTVWQSSTSAPLTIGMPLRLVDAQDRLVTVDIAPDAVDLDLPEPVSQVDSLVRIIADLYAAQQAA